MAKRREANFVESGVRTYHNVKKFIEIMISIHKKSKYRYFIVKELRMTELNYVEQLTRMVGIKEQLCKSIVFSISRPSQI